MRAIEDIPGWAWFVGWLVILAIAGGVDKASAETIAGHVDGDERITETSKGSWGSADGFTSIAVGTLIDGKYLPLVWRGCRGAAIAYGVAITVRTCGDPAHVKVRAAALSGGHHVRVRFRGDR